MNQKYSNFQKIKEKDNNKIKVALIVAFLKNKILEILKRKKKMPPPRLR